MMIGGAAVVAAVGALIVPQSARADVPLNEAAAFAVNVPSSVLAEAASSPAAAATLASNQAYDWAMASPKFSTVSGASTSTPAASSALTAAERAEWEALVQRFAAPATKAAPLARSAGSLPLLAFQVGLLVGQGGARTFGFADDTVCAERNTALTIAASVLDGVDCGAFENRIAEAQRNVDQSPLLTFDPVTTGGYTVTHLGSFINRDPSHPFPLLNCFRADGPPVVTPTVLLIDTRNGPDFAWGSGGSEGIAPLQACQEKNHFPTANREGGYTSLPFQWRVEVFNTDGTGTPSISEWMSPKSVAYPNPQRQLRCTIVTSDYKSYDADSAPYTETDSVIPSPVCPTPPPGSVVIKQRFAFIVGGIPTEYASNPTTDAYQLWATQHRECSSGSCPTVLFKNGVNCFQTIDPDECGGWVDAADRDSVYTCRVGTQPAPLSDCFIYGQLFNTLNRDSGHAYADPATGGPIPSQTSPTRTDRLTEALLSDGKTWVSWDALTTKLGDAQTESSRGATVRAIAKQCVAQDLSDEECETLPIFAPGSDIPEATQNDIQGLVENPTWARLNYADTGDRAPDRWYDKTPPCARGTYNLDPANPQDCDEFPYRSSLQGGPGAQIQPISAVDNRKEGLYLGYF